MSKPQVSSGWEKLGLIFRPDLGFDWMQTHAWVPVVESLGNGTFKVYFSSRNANNMSQTGFFIFNIAHPGKIVEVSKEPVIRLGSLGLFDDSAAVACGFVQKDEKTKYLYYVGWMQAKRVRYYPSIGLAISTDNGVSFQKYSRAPLIDRSDDEPFGMASPFVMLDQGTWRMWYASYRRWDLRDGDPWPQYEIRYAESTDGIHWVREGKVCIGSDSYEAVARPWVIKEDNTYRMWYCYRVQQGNYRIGYAESNDAQNWSVLNNEMIMDVSSQGWDSQMIEYPCVFKHANQLYMLYNGNSFGLEGIGLARLNTI